MGPFCTGEAAAERLAVGAFPPIPPYSPRAMRAIAAAILVVLACAGCAKPTGPSALSFDSKDYAAVFDAAVECARASTSCSRRWSTATLASSRPARAMRGPS